MRASVALAFLAVTACATSHPDTSRPATESVRYVGQTGTGNIRLSAGDGAATAKVAFAPDQVWAVLPAIYDSLGVPVETVDPTRRLIGNLGFKAHQKLGKTSLSKYIDCGRTQGFPSADSYDVHMVITTQVQPGDQGTSTVSTFVEAAARPMAYSGEYVKCSSLGLMESAINNAVRARLAKS
jgi:hypothetical protein